MAETRTILILAGTPEARALADRLTAHAADFRVVLSFAGAVSSLPDTPGETRIGGFGGAEGLADYLRVQAVDLVIDATHPFARQMSANADRACRSTGTRLLRLLRAPWERQAADHWREFASTAEALSALPDEARPFLALGRRELEDCHGIAARLPAVFRSIEAPAFPLPSGWIWLQGRPGQTKAEERVLLEAHGITHVVTKNSGGMQAFHKIAAARDLGRPVFMVQRPPEPDRPTFDTVEATFQAIVTPGT